MSPVRHNEHAHLAPPGDPAVALAVIVMSAGGLAPLRNIVETIPPVLHGAVIVAAHAAENGQLDELIRFWTDHPVVLAFSGMTLREGMIYVCPAQHHLVVNPDATLTVTRMERIRYVRPSFDWLLESVAAAYAERSTTVLLSGSNDDGVRGARCVAEAGGTVFVQSPETCAAPQMPRFAMQTGAIYAPLPPERLGNAVATNLLHTKATWPRAWDPFAMPA